MIIPHIFILHNYITTMQSVRHLIMNFPVLLLLLISSVSFSLINAAPRDGRIIGGWDAKPRSHPYIVSLQMRFLWARMRLCSGSLLSQRWILTAGHCVKGSWLINWLTMEAVVGTNNLEHKEPSAQTVKIAERIPHPNYDGGIGPYDIAMLRTDKNIIFTQAVSPIEVPMSMGSFTHRNQLNRNLMVAGWGVLETTTFIPSLPDKLQEARVEYLPFDECYKAIDAVKETYEDNPLDIVANICTGPITGGIAACSGDSGGPLIQYIPYNYVGSTTTTTLAANQGNADITTINVENGAMTSTTKPTTVNEHETVTTEGVETELESIITKDSSTEEIKGGISGLIIPAEDQARSYKNDGLIPVVIGVVSWGISPCGEKGAPTVYTNTSTYADFIFQHLYSVVPRSLTLL